MDVLGLCITQQQGLLMSYKMTGICLPNESYYTDQRIQNYVLDNFEGIVFAGKQQGFDFWVLNKKELNKSMTLNGEFKKQYPELRPYIDEPISNPNNDNRGWWVLQRLYPDTIIGELGKFEQIKCNITYTAYKDLWFTIFGCRIYKWWGNQIKTWEKLQKEFGDRFSICWINLSQDKKELIEWAEAHNKETWLYVEYNMTIKEILKISN